jgi:hypothetical protein
MDADNTSGFNCRNAVRPGHRNGSAPRSGGDRRQHGREPYVYEGRRNRLAGAEYLDRSVPAGDGRRRRPTRAGVRIGGLAVGLAVGGVARLPALLQDRRRAARATRSRAAHSPERPVCTPWERRFVRCLAPAAPRRSLRSSRDCLDAGRDAAADDVTDDDDTLRHRGDPVRPTSPTTPSGGSRSRPGKDRTCCWPSDGAPRPDVILRSCSPTHRAASTSTTSRSPTRRAHGFDVGVGCMYSAPDVLEPGVAGSLRGRALRRVADSMAAALDSLVRGAYGAPARRRRSR